jgi:glucose/arabinose dehydrogenase
MRLSCSARLHAITILVAATLLPVALHAQQTITGDAAFADYTLQEPGVMHKITSADLSAPFATESVDNGPNLINRPSNAWPIAPAGFKVQFYAGGDAAKPMQRSDDIRKTYSPTSGTFVMPRVIHTAPNGDLFLADSQAGSIFVLRGVTADGKAESVSEFAFGLDHPFGIAFYPAGPNPRSIYVGTATEIGRFPYKSGELKAETNTPDIVIPDIPGYAQLRGAVIAPATLSSSADCKYMLVSVGSGSNISMTPIRIRASFIALLYSNTPRTEHLSKSTPMA